MIAKASSTVVDGLPTLMTGVTDAELDIIRGLMVAWREKYPRNQLRSAYFNARVPLRPSGNIPREAMARISAVVDWPEKAVSALAERSIFEGFVSPGDDQDPFELRSVLDANRWDLELPQAITSAYKHSCSFITTAAGDVQSGEPRVLVMARSAEWSVATWDRKRRTVGAFLAITDTDDRNRPTAMDVYLPEKVLLCRRRPSGSWVAETRENKLREVLVEPLVYDPALDRPFGRSRISRPVMNITDHALSTIVRNEIGADFYTLPKIIITRIAEDAFKNGKWNMVADRVSGLTTDEDGNAPDVKQLQQMTMQPLMDQYRMHASRFSGATGVPVSSLGIITENPPSAEAIYADDRRLTTTAKKQNRIMTASLRRVGSRIVRLRDGGDGSSELGALDVNWARPEFISPGSGADAVVKLAVVWPFLAESEVGMEMAGFSRADITRLMADKRRAQGGAMTAAVRDAIAANAAAQATPAPVPPADEVA